MALANSTAINTTSGLAVITALAKDLSINLAENRPIKTKTKKFSSIRNVIPATYLLLRKMDFDFVKTVTE